MFLVQTDVTTRGKSHGKEMGFFGLALLIGSSSTLAVNCGDHLTGGSVRIDEDIGPCTEDPALTVEGPANVNFNGFTVECEEAGTTGIVITGHNATVQNGTVLNCEDGIRVAGDGQHQILKMTVTSSQQNYGNRGFRVTSDDNRLVGNMAQSFNGEGFRVEGEANRLVNNQALNNSGHGFRLEGNGKHQLINNRAEGNAQEGFRLDSDDNSLINNVGSNNGDEGFRARNGAGNSVINNRAKGNGATNDEAGFRIQSVENLLLNNTAVENVGDGILLQESAESNEVAHNTAHNNGDTDLVDENLDCDNNDWFENKYDTRNQDCIH
jgi:parallel beta-helix repeat protein